ncbi:MAG: hypothetical protein CMF61_04085 [Magnetococcales bacterium]|nr:hypothetical protein [Magnetococcales bacterium]|tara:strand:+ start:3294 stop:3947 length:654 start_codon:yes stop_codon:yes gene_type:complete
MCDQNALSNEAITETLKTAPAELRTQMVQTWLAFSATNIPFTEDGQLILGILPQGDVPNAIPENGPTCLIGGFNGGLVSGPCSFAELADVHAKNMLNINVSGCVKVSSFSICEYPAEAMAEPLNTPYGAFPIKRVAFERYIVLSKEQFNNIEVGGKIVGIKTVSYEEFVADYLNGDQGSRFKYQLETIDRAFKNVHAQGYTTSFWGKVKAWLNQYVN